MYSVKTTISDVTWFGLLTCNKLNLVNLHSFLCTEPPQFKQDSQTTCPDIKPKGEQLSPKEKNPPLPIKMEWSEDVKIEPKEEEEMFSDSEEGDTMEQLATKSKMLHDMINQLGEQIADQRKKIAKKDELIGKYQQMGEGLQKSKQWLFNILSFTLQLTRQYKLIMLTSVQVRFR